MKYDSSAKIWLLLGALLSSPSEVTGFVLPFQGKPYNSVADWSAPPLVLDQPANGRRRLAIRSKSNEWRRQPRDDGSLSKIIRQPGLYSNNNRNFWDGDDLRFLSRLRRRIRRSLLFSSGGYYQQPVQKSLIWIMGAVFLWQTVNTVQTIAKKHAQYWPSKAWLMIWDALLGSATPGALTRDFGMSQFWAKRQPHRWLTSGFLHGGLVHLLLNMIALRRQPAWLETGLGGGLYLTTFLLCIIAGNLGHVHLGFEGVDASSVVLGASGGIAGLYGLMFVSLSKMGYDRTFSKIIRPLGLLFLYGVFVEKVNNAVHFGGFLGGVVLGILCGPNYEKSYGARRKWSLEVDDLPRDYRAVMGFGIKPTSRGYVPLPVLWVLLGALLATIPQSRWIPRTVLKSARASLPL